MRKAKIKMLKGMMLLFELLGEVTQSLSDSLWQTADWFYNLTYDAENTDA